MKVWSTISRLIEQGQACALVSIVETKGSVPRGTDAFMIVTAQGYHGSIGGGTLEWKAMATAQAMLGQGAAARIVNYSLGPDLGQCCGGRVQVAIEVMASEAKATADELAQRESAGAFGLMRVIAGQEVEQRFGEQARHLYVFGAGHVGRALTLALAPLPFAITWVDSRPNAFPSHVPENVTLVQSAEIASLISHAPETSLALVLTHSHALDLEIVDATLRNANFAEVGLIGSQTKRARFEKRLREAGVAPERIAGLHCPIGVEGIASKHPAAIAASTVAQLLQWDSRLHAQALDATHNSSQQFG